MTTYTYTGRLTDLGLGALVAMMPQMRVHPESEAFGPDGLVSQAPKTVALQADGSFSMTLIPSGELTSAKTGRTGVPYVIEVGRFEQGLDGTQFVGVDVWRFTAVAGGGNIGGMAGGSMLAVWIGPPWPSPVRPGLYIDTAAPNDWGILS